MILDERPCCYLNTNGIFYIILVVLISLFIGRIVDPMTVYREGKVTSSWSEEEKAIFKNKLVMLYLLISIVFVVGSCYFLKTLRK